MAFEAGASSGRGCRRAIGRPRRAAVDPVARHPVDDDPAWVHRRRRVAVRCASEDGGALASESMAGLWARAALLEAAVVPGHMQKGMAAADEISMPRWSRGGIASGEKGLAKLGVRKLHEDAFPNEESSPRKSGNDEKADNKAKRD